MVQDSNHLNKLLFLEQSIPNGVAEGISADATQPVTAGWRLVGVQLDPVQCVLDRVQAALCLVRNMLVVVRLVERWRVVGRYSSRGTTLAAARLPLIEGYVVVRVRVGLGDALLQDRPLTGGHVVGKFGLDDITKLDQLRRAQPFDLFKERRVNHAPMIRGRTDI